MCGPSSEKNKCDQSDERKLMLSSSRRAESRKKTFRMYWMCPLSSCTLLTWVPGCLAHFASSLWELWGCYWRESGQAGGKTHNPDGSLGYWQTPCWIGGGEASEAQEFPQAARGGVNQGSGHITKPYKRSTSPTHPAKIVGCSSYAFPMVNMQKIQPLGLWFTEEGNRT